MERDSRLGSGCSGMSGKLSVVLAGGNVKTSEKAQLQRWVGCADSFPRPAACYKAVGCTQCCLQPGSFKAGGVVCSLNVTSSICQRTHLVSEKTCS